MIVACVAGLWACPATAELTGYESLANWGLLPLEQTGVTAGLASSYDRSGGNSDYCQYESPSGIRYGDEAVVVLRPVLSVSRKLQPAARSSARFLGAKAVQRACQNAARFVLQTSAPTPHADAYLSGAYGYANSPLVSALIGGQVSYEPIAFSQSAVIETRNKAIPASGWSSYWNYYQYGYHLLGAGQSVTPYTGSLNTAQQAARAAAVSVINNVGANPDSAAGTLLPTAAGSIAAGDSAVLADIAGGGKIQALRLKMSGATDAQLDGLRLRVRYDGQSDYAIDVPVSQFFGVGHQRAAYKSVAMGNDADTGFYSYWPMPYRNGATVQLYNSTGSAIPIGSAAVQYDSTWVVPPDAGYFRAAYNEETTVAGQAYHQLLNVAGRGTYVGNLLYLEKSGNVRTLLEGDDIVTVNPGAPGENVLYGTGLEDAYNGGYYYNHVAVLSSETPSPTSGAGPYSGLLNMNFVDMPSFAQNPVTRTDQYRWLIGDSVPYTNGLNVKIENYGALSGALFGSTAFYYSMLDPGDVNSDGQVGLMDYNIIKANFGNVYGSGTHWGDGDLNGDGQVGLLDFNIVKAHFGHTAGSSPETAVPEPATLLGLFGAIPILSGLKRRATP
ncbi:MAG: DUF2961 domain-containing protein [Planctomycetota bacterium]|nr:DUF2961 domain-containing protein [Planctomycetota bacterium]